MDGRAPGPAAGSWVSERPALNLLLHLELALRDLGQASAAGALLPDLWRMADPRARASTRALPFAVPLDPHIEPPARGVLHHLALDRLFHDDEHLLGAGQRAAAAVLRRGGWPRPGLLAHPAWELALDGALVRHLGAETMLAQLRACLAHLGPSTLATLASGFRLSCADEVSFRTRLGDLLARLHEGAWPQGYAEPEGLARRLAGLGRRVGLDTSRAAAIDFDQLLRQAALVLPRALELRPDPSAFAAERLTRSGVAPV